MKLTDSVLKVGEKTASVAYLGTQLVYGGGLLDLYGGAAAAYSLRKLSAAYSGPAIRVRRSSDNTEQDIGFVNGELDTTSLLNFVGAGNDGFVRTWYDQSGNNLNASQTTTSRQPTIVSLGNLKYYTGSIGMTFDGTDALATPSITSYSQPVTVFSVHQLDSTANNQRIYTSGSLYMDTLSPKYRIVAGSSLLNGALDTNPQIAYVLFNGSSTSVFNINTAVATGGVGTNTSGTLTIGNSGALSSPLFGCVHELIIYRSNQSSISSSVLTNINAYYQIYWDGSQTSLLDTYSGSAAAYSLRALSSAYTGPLVRVRRASDNAEQDIYAKYDGTLNVSALESFCSGTDGFVRTWYDQSGNNRHVAMTTDANQPQILTNGAINYENGFPVLFFDGSNDVLTGSGFTNFLDVTKDFTVINVFRARILNERFIFNIALNANNRINQIVSSSRYTLNTNGVLTGFIYTINTTDTYLSFLTNSPQDMYVNNMAASSSTGYNSFNSTTFSLGARSDAASAASINLNEFIIFDSNKSSDRTGISTNINNFYSIYCDGSVPVWNKSRYNQTNASCTLSYISSNPTSQTFSTSTISVLSGASKYVGAVTAPNGSVYCVPSSASTVLKINTNGTRSYFGSLGTSGGKWEGGVLAPNGKIYCAPHNSSSILVIDPTNDTTYTIGSLGTATAKWSGGVVALNDKIYFTPKSSDSILVLDPKTETTSLIAGYGSTANKYIGSVLGPNGKIYFIPFDATSVLVFNPETNTSTTIGSLTGSSKWFGGVLAPNGNIYGIPIDSTTVLKINTSNDTVSTFGSITGTGKYLGGVLGANGLIYGVPGSNTQVMIINPATDAISFSGTVSGTYKYAGGALGGDGKIYCAPLEAANSLTMLTATTPDANIPLSRLFNKL